MLTLRRGLLLVYEAQVFGDTIRSVDAVISPRFFFCLHSKCTGLYQTIYSHYKIKNMNIKKYWMMLAIALVGLCTISCSGDDDDDNPNESTITENDPEGTIIENVHHKDYVELFHMRGSGFDITSYIYLNKSNNFETNGNIVSVGKVKGLNGITKIPISGWSTKVAAVPGTGYVLQDEYKGASGCARIYVVDYIVDTTGGIIGVIIKYQPDWNPNDEQIRT